MNASEKFNAEFKAIDVGTKADMDKIAEEAGTDPSVKEAVTDVLVAYAGIFFGLGKCVKAGTPHALKLVELGLDDTSAKLDALGRLYARFAEEFNEEEGEEEEEVALLEDEEEEEEEGDDE